MPTSQANFICLALNHNTVSKGFTGQVIYDRYDFLDEIIYKHFFFINHMYSNSLFNSQIHDDLSKGPRECRIALNNQNLWSKLVSNA